MVYSIKFSQKKFLLRIRHNKKHYLKYKCKEVLSFLGWEKSLLLLFLFIIIICLLGAYY